MEFSSPRLKALTVTIGISFWLIVLMWNLDIFSLELYLGIVAIIFTTFQILSLKVSKALDVFAIYNTKIFLGILFCTVISIYGILFRLLRIDLLRLKKQDGTYWLDVEQTKPYRIGKQY